MEQFNINIAKYDVSIFKGKACKVTLQTDDGEFCITKNHIPTIALLAKSGSIKCELADGKSEIFKVNSVSGGFCIYENNILNIFA